MKTASTTDVEIATIWLPVTKYGAARIIALIKYETPVNRAEIVADH